MSWIKNGCRCGECYFWDKGYCDYHKKRIAEDAIPCKEFEG